MIIIVPYRNNGKVLLSRPRLKYIFDSAVNDNVIKKVFFDGAVKTFQDFLKFVEKFQYTFGIFVDEEKTICGFLYLTNVTKASVQIHFCLFKNSWGAKSLKIADTVKKYFKSIPGLKTVYGMTPANNNLALRSINKILGKQTGIVPNMFWDEYNQENVDGIVNVWEV